MQGRKTQNPSDNLKDIALLDQSGNPICGSVGDNTDMCQKIAGEGTDHPLKGFCHNHDPEHSQTVMIQKVSQYGKIIQDSRLKQYFSDVAAAGDLDNLDEEITLLRAFILHELETFGVEYDENEKGLIEIKSEFSLGIQRDNISGRITQLSTLIKRKYEVLQISGEVVSRDRVREYISMIELTIDRILDNTCSECRHEHGLRDKTIQALSELGDL